MGFRPKSHTDNNSTPTVILYGFIGMILEDNSIIDENLTKSITYAIIRAAINKCEQVKYNM